MDILFLSFTGLVAAGVVATLTANLGHRARNVGLVGFAAWLGYTGAFGYFGVIAGSWHGVPGPAFILFPVVLFIALFLSRSAAAAKVALAIPLSLLLGAQVFRTVVELFLHQLAAAGLAPRMLTYEGANFDILIGLSAPFVAWAFARGRLSNRAALAWNVAGLAMLANIIIRAVMTAPGPLNLLATEVPNRAIGLFPYTFIPGLMAPLALSLHVLAIRALRARNSQEIKKGLAN